MEDLFKKREISPMLLYQTTPFDSEDYIFELKFDGARCIAYLDGQKTDLRNKRNKDINQTFPEFKYIYKNVKQPCILDGELIVMKNGKPDFHALLSRSLKTDKFKIDIASKRNPANFIAYDILQINDKILVDLPLIERKKILQENLIENERISYSRYIEKEGIKFFNLAKEKELEGIIAKQKNSKYYLGKRSKVWQKIKVMHEAYVVICGYIEVDQGGIDLLMGAYNKDNQLIYLGNIHGISKTDREIIIEFSKKNYSKPLFKVNLEKKIFWLKPELVGLIKYMTRNETGRMRQAIFQGLTNEKKAEDCIL